jgi:peptidoglycan/LPS O-acetylase OafA/YrhL
LHSNASAHSHVAYRPDIDGLRALAVLSVMAFHLQIRFASGGFIGVDVFFVISGFLITSIILSDLDRNRFLLSDFYARRIRRILPALIALLLAATVLAFFLCLPLDLLDYASNLFAASMSVSNIYFGLHSGYFEPISLSRPLLHTWSLGVEDQFYLLFPPTVLLLRRWIPRHLPLALGVLAAISFAASWFESVNRPDIAFFMPWTRACELLFGSLLATGSIPRAPSFLARNLASVLGMLLIATSFVFVNAAGPLPGLGVLIPCGGAMLLIWSGQAHSAAGDSPLPRPTLLARLLGSRPLVFVGLISYSLYLWHWPVVVFQGISLWGSELPPRFLKAILFLISFLLAILSWRFVEQPFRDGILRLKRRYAFIFAATSSLFLIALALTIPAAKGFPARFATRAVEVGSYTHEKPNNRFGSCMVTRARDFQPDPCLREDPDKANWLLIGDSHAAAQWQGLVAAYPGIHFLQGTLSSCLPAPATTDGDCGDLSRMIFLHFLATHHIEGMIVEARWYSTDIPRISRLVAWTREHLIPLTIIGPTQEYEAPLPLLLAYEIQRHDPTLADRHRKKRVADLDAELAGLARDQWKVPYISLISLVCPSGQCNTYVDANRTVPVLIDRDHLSNMASLTLGRRIAAEHLLDIAPDASTDNPRYSKNSHPKSLSRPHTPASKYHS